MTAARLFAALLLLTVSACSTHVEALEAEVSRLRASIRQRETLAAEADDLDEFEGRLSAWRDQSGEARLLVPVPPFSLDPYRLAPLGEPLALPKAVVESGRSNALRAQVDALRARARELDRTVSALELRKAQLRVKLASANQIEQARVDISNHTPLFDVGTFDAGVLNLPVVPPGGMRRAD